MTAATIDKTLLTRKEWEVVKLGDVCEFIGGSQPEKSYFQRELLPDYIRLVQIQDFRRSDLKVYIPISEAKRSFDETDIMIGRYGPPVFQIFRGLSGAYNVALIKAAPNTLKLTKDYLFFLLKEPSIQNRVIAQSQRSAGQTGVDKAFLENIKIPLPPLTIQKEIADYLQFRLTCLEEAKQAVKAELEAAKALKQAYLREVFGSRITPIDGLHVLDLIEKGKSVQSASSFKSAILTSDTVKLGDVCESIQYGSSEQMNTEEKGYKTFRMNEIVNGVMIDRGNMKYSDLSESDYLKYRLNIGDILFNRTNSIELVGKTGLFNLQGEYLFASYLIRLKVIRTIIHPEFLSLYMNSDKFQTEIKKTASQSIGQANINAQSLSVQQIPLPPLAVQKEIADYLQTKFTTVDTLVQALKEKKKAIDDLPQAFLREVFGNTDRAG